MDYKDRDGNLVKNTTNQDKFLDFVYSHAVTRFGMKLLSAPIVSKAAGAFLDTWPSTFMISSFVRKNNIRMSDYEHRKFRSYNDFFTRKIRPGKRPIDRAPEHLIAPCDAYVTAYPIELNTRLHIKNSVYSVESILQDKELATKFSGGYCVILRLAVDNYHRYCYVDNAAKGRNHFIQGTLSTVNPAILDHIKIYKENSRSYCLLKTENFGPVIQMEVGALMVGKICNYHREAMVKRGQEKGKFEFGGSTVVLFIQRDRVVLDEDILKNTSEQIETKVRMGEKIGEAMFV